MPRFGRGSARVAKAAESRELAPRWMSYPGSASLGALPGAARGSPLVAKREHAMDLMHFVVTT